MKHYIIILCSLFIVSSAIFAQNRDNKWAIGLHLSSLNYENAITKQYYEVGEWTGGGGITISRYLAKDFDLSLEGTYGHVFLPIRNSDNSVTYTHKEPLLSGSLMLKYKMYNGYMFKEDAPFAPYFLAGINLTNVDETNKYFAPLGMGLNIRMGKAVSLRLESKYLLSVESKQDFDYLQHTVGLQFNFGANDVVKEVVELAEVPKDTDNDGVTDDVDECVSIKGPKENRGCPWPDADKDGVADQDDKCPLSIGLAVNDGCPDTDGDGIFDNDDKCPDLAGVVSNGGCPREDDRDGDGIRDDLDVCPDLAGVASNGGCPEIAEEDKKIIDIAFANLEFESGKSVIRQSSYSSLNDLVDLLRQRRTYKLLIEGHTDNVGAADSNLKLSKARADAVKNYLVKNGTDANRLTAKGYGESSPISTNDTKEGRQKNRRVEMKIVF